MPDTFLRSTNWRWLIVLYSFIVAWLRQLCPGQRLLDLFGKPRSTARADRLYWHASVRSSAVCCSRRLGAGSLCTC